MLPSCVFITAICMRNIPKILSLCLLCTGSAMPASAVCRDSVRRIGFSADTHAGRIISMDMYQRMYQQKKQSFSIAAQLNFHTLPTDSDAFAEDYDYPVISLGLRYSINNVTMHRGPDFPLGQAKTVDYDSRLGNIVSLYAAFNRTFLRRHRWSADYTLAAGMSYAHKKYDPYNNVDNELIGSRFLIYFGAGIHAHYRLSGRWGLRAGIDYYHHSNGALNRPNKGANIWGPTVGIEYFPTAEYGERFAKHASQKSFIPYWYAAVALGIGGKVLNEDWLKTQYSTPPDSADYRTGRFHFYNAYSVQVDIMRRYARRWASGMGIDLFYGSYAARVEALDKADGYRTKHSPWSVGIAAKHQVYYHNWSMAMALGWYLYRHMGQNAEIIEKPYYERIGIHYTIPALRGLTIGANVKAHLTKADFTEVVIVYPFRLE